MADKSSTSSKSGSTASSAGSSSRSHDVKDVEQRAKPGAEQKTGPANTRASSGRSGSRKTSQRASSTNAAKELAQRPGPDENPVGETPPIPRESKTDRAGRHKLAEEVEAILSSHEGESGRGTLVESPPLHKDVRQMRGQGTYVGDRD